MSLNERGEVEGGNGCMYVREGLGRVAGHSILLEPVCTGVTRRAGPGICQRTYYRRVSM